MKNDVDFVMNLSSAGRFSVYLNHPGWHEIYSRFKETKDMNSKQQ